MKGCEDEARQARAEKHQYQPDSLSGGEPRISSEIRHWQWQLPTQQEKSPSRQLATTLPLTSQVSASLRAIVWRVS
jgi:hypothetical protein